MRDFSNRFKRPRTTSLIKTTSHDFAIGLPDHKKNKASREIRRGKVWELSLQGNSPTEIATLLGYSVATIHEDLKKSREMVRPLLIQDSIDHVTQYISEQQLIMKKAFERIEKIEHIEDLWVERTFGGEDRAEEAWWEGPPEGDLKTRKPRDNNRGGNIPFSLKQESVSPLLAEAAKASTNMASVKGVKNSGNNVNVNVSIDMMTDAALLIALKNANVDPANLGLIIEGEKTEVKELPPYEHEQLHEEFDVSVFEEYWEDMED